VTYEARDVAVHSTYGAGGGVNRALESVGLLIMDARRVLANQPID
jgi:hypothetical protein